MGIKIITFLSIVFFGVLFFQINSVIAQTTNPPLSGTKIELPLKRDCKKDSQLVNNTLCCPSPSTVCRAGDTLCLTGGVKLVRNTLNCQYADKQTKTATEAGYAYIEEDPEYCAEKLGLNKKFVCGPFVKKNDIIYQGVLCLGPGGSNDNITKAIRVVCCPAYTDELDNLGQPTGKKDWYFYQHYPAINADPWDRCPNEVEYLIDNKMTKVDFKVLTPEQVCDKDSEINSKTQSSDELKRQCCTCLGGNSVCDKDWTRISQDKDLKDNSWTGIGCINRSQTGLATSLMRIFYGVGLVFLLLKIIMIGFDYQSGDPEKIKEARYGVLAVIVAFTVGTIGLIALRFIGLDVLGLDVSTNIDTLIPIFK